MSNEPATEQPVSPQERAKRIFRRACEDIGVTHQDIATQLHRNRTKVDRWASSASDEAVPVWALLVSAAIPNALFERIVTDVRTFRSSSATTLIRTAEGTAHAWLAKANEAMGEIIIALADGRISRDEAERILRLVSDVESFCAEVRRVLSGIASGAVVQMPKREVG